MPPVHPRHTPAATLRHARWLLAITAASLMLLTARGIRPFSTGGDGDVHVLPSDMIVIAPGASVQLEAFFGRTGGAPSALTWTSTDSTVATVDTDGRATGVTTGATTITLTSPNDEGISAAVTIVVSAPLPTETELPITGDTVIVSAMVDGSPTPASLEAGAAGTITRSAAATSTTRSVQAMPMATPFPIST